MKLWLDIGNTRLKWQLCQSTTASDSVDEGFIVHDSDIQNAIEKLSLILKQKGFLNSLQNIGLASVLNARTLALTKASIQKYMSIEAQVACVKKDFLGLHCAYEDVSRLGVDRWLALLAAFKLSSSPVCVVDCGSALTIDVANSLGEHLGGFILPGLNMSTRALLGQTDSVRFTDDAQLGALNFGVDSASAVKNGALLQAQAAIKEAWRLCQKQSYFENAQVFVTGGDASVVAHDLGLDCTIKNDLVIEGLRFALAE